MTDVLGLAGRIKALDWNVSAYTVSGTDDATEMATQIVGLVYKFKFSAQLRPSTSKAMLILLPRIRVARQWVRNTAMSDASGACFPAATAESIIQASTRSMNSTAESEVLKKMSELTTSDTTVLLSGVSPSSTGRRAVEVILQRPRAA